MTTVIRDLFTHEEWELLCALDNALCESIENYPQELVEEKERKFETLPSW